jgi:hypothetical protein
VEWCSRDLQHTHITATEILSTLADTGRVIQQSSAITEQLLAFSSQQKATSDAIEQLETEFLLEIADVPGQSGLSDSQVQRRLGDSAQFSHGDERSYVPQVHKFTYAKSF